MQKSSEILRSHLELSEKSLKSMEEEAQVTKNLISEYEELHKALVEAKTKAQKDKTREVTEGIQKMQIVKWKIFIRIYKLNK